MPFQNKEILVFLYSLMHLYICDSIQPDGINKTVFLFDHPINCKRSEIYNFDNFSCIWCDSKYHLEPSFDKASCFCAKNYKTIALYDSQLKRPICAKPCKNKKADICPSLTTAGSTENTCGFYYVNKTNDQSDSIKRIRIFTYTSDNFNNCTCNQRNNYVYNSYCIWKDLLQNSLNYNAFWQRGKVYADLKFVSFFCQYLHNKTACNHLANLCIESFFDTDKNSPCSAFFLAQASDASLYSSIGEELKEFQPYLFYKRGKDTTQELEKKFKYSYKNSKISMELSTVVYSLEGQLIRWGPFRRNHINLCSYRGDGPFSNIEFFKSFHISCDLSMDTIIDLANLFANKQFFSVFLNYSIEESRYMHTIPILIDNAFDGNMEPNIAEWQMVKRFQLISANPSLSSLSSRMPHYEDNFKLRLFKNINILRKFELHCTVARDNTISLPYIVLSYHRLNISSNTSLDELFKFELSVKFEKEHKLDIIYKICLPICLVVSFGMAIFRSYTLRCRRYLECCDMAIITQFILLLMSNIGNSFLISVIIDVTYSAIVVISHPEMILISPDETLQIPKLLTYSAILLKSLNFFTYFWNIARVDVFFVDWERPKSCETSLHLKNNLDNSSQCSSIPANAENNVSAWRTFFVANEWIKLSNERIASIFTQGFSSLTLYWFITSVYPLLNSNESGRLMICVFIYSLVHMIQRIFKNTVLTQICGNAFKRFMDICTMTNVSILALVDSSYGYYIHGRSPHGFADTDMQSIILQLHRESQNMCAKRGLLSDSDFQTYIVLPPFKLSAQIHKLSRMKPNTENLSQVHFQTETNFEGTLKESTIACNRLNRFLCAFIDHAIKDMDYIIKEKGFIESMLSCEFDSFLTENKGTFYIDNNLAFSSLFPYGNQNKIFLMELVLLLTLEFLTNSFVASILIVCIYTKIVFRAWVRNNIAKKTLIDKRFLM